MNKNQNSERLSINFILNPNAPEDKEIIGYLIKYREKHAYKSTALAARAFLFEGLDTYEEIQLLKSKNEEANVKITEANLKYADATSRYEETINQLRTEDKQQAAKIAELNQTDAQQKAAIIQLQTENKQQSAIIVTLNQTDAQQKAAITQLQTEKKQQTIIIAELKQTDAEQKTAITQLQTENKQQNAAIVQLKQDGLKIARELKEERQSLLSMQDIDEIQEIYPELSSKKVVKIAVAYLQDCLKKEQSWSFLSTPTMPSKFIKLKK